MHDSRKTLLNVLIDNLVNIFNITLVVLLIILILNQSYLFIIPLALSLIASIFSLCLDIKKYLLVSGINQRLNIVIDGVEKERSFSRLKVGDHVALYPNEKINFVGIVKNGHFLVDEKSINGATKLIKKVAGSSIVKGSVVVEGKGVVEVTELGKRFAKRTPVKRTKLTHRIKLLNSIFSLLVLLVILLTFIFKKDNLNNIVLCSIAATPYLLNIIITIYFFILSKKENSGIEVLDYSFLLELKDVDVVCLDKTGTLTTGEYEVFKTIPLSQSALSAIAIDTNRALEQTVSNIIRTTQEKTGYYSVLQKHFIFDVTRTIESFSPVGENGLYSAITIKGGNTYALGEVDSFDLSNIESASSIINEYQSLGYLVLVLVESKKPLKSGLIEGKSTAIGLIVLQETIRESMNKLIEYCLINGKQIKVISGDRIATTSEICRKAGLDNVNKATSIKLVSNEKIALLLEQDVVFADATPDQKAFIVKELQNNGHKVAYIGDGDNDTQALKIADVAISMSSGSQSAIKCSHASINGSFEISKSFIDQSKSFTNKIYSLTAILYSQTTFVAFYLLVFMIASFINKDIYNPFEYNHLLLCTIFGDLIPVCVLLFSKCDCSTPKNFYRNYIANSSLLITAVGILYILLLLQFNGISFFGLLLDTNDVHETLITSKVVDNISYLALTILSLVIAYNHYSQFNKYKTICFICITLLPIIYAILLAFNIDNLSFITQISTKEITAINYFVMGVIVLASSAIYLFVLNIIAIVKGETPDVKSKSKN